MIIFPEQNELASDFLRRRVSGRAMILLNVRIDGQLTSVCENNTRGGAWRTRHGRSARGRLKDYGNVEVLSETISLSCNDATALADALPVVSNALIQHCGRCSPIGNIPRTDPMMLKALTALESCSADIRSSIGIDLTTEMFQVRRSLRTSVCLCEDGKVSVRGSQLLKAFHSSRSFYEVLPELREFVGTKRTTGDPSDGGGKIRKWIEQRQFLNLPTGERLRYVEYELKPLRVSQILNWSCNVAISAKANPRKDSVDVLLEYNSSPVFVEVKAAGDSFCSAALAQVLYYGCILATERQRRRLNRHFSSIKDSLGWLCVIAQERDEAKPKERGFAADEHQTIQFLRHPAIKKALGSSFQGCLIIVVATPASGDLAIVRSTTVLFAT